MGTAYNELIKNFSRIRAYMREFYIYGFKSRSEYTYKSARSYDNERRRVESWLFGSYAQDYLHDAELCRRFACRNRELIAETLLDLAALTAAESFHTVHNYIDTNNMILRKGAISAQKGERLLIPINMRDGSVLAVGRGNPEWNYSAPHGAGRVLSRSEARSQLTLDEFRRSMHGIYTTSVNESTLDESPMAYKPIENIIGDIAECVDIVDIIKPVYNFKAS